MLLNLRQEPTNIPQITSLFIIYLQPCPHLSLVSFEKKSCQPLIMSLTMSYRKMSDLKNSGVRRKFAFFQGIPRIVLLFSMLPTLLLKLEIYEEL